MDDYEFVEKCLDATGGPNARFQKVMITFILISSFGLPDLFIYAYSFFTVAPSLECSFDQGQTWAPCSKTIACNSNDDVEFQPDYSDPQTIKNWIVYLNMYCDDNYDLRVSFFGTALMIGYFLGSIFITPMGDTYGRMKMHTFLAITQTIFVALTIIFTVYTTSYISVVVLNFLLGLVTAPRYNMCIMYGLEFTNKDYQKVYSLIAWIIAGSMSIILGLEFMWIKSMIPGLIFLVVSEIIIIIILYCFVPDTPYFLLKKGDLKGFYKTLKIIAKFNGENNFDVKEMMTLHHQMKKNQNSVIQQRSESLEDLDTEQVTQEEKDDGPGFKHIDIADDDNTEELLLKRSEQEHKKSQIDKDDIRQTTSYVNRDTFSFVQTPNSSVCGNIKKLCSIRPILINTIVLCIIWSTSSFTFYFVEFYMKLVPTDNIFLLSMVIGLADIVSSFLFYWFVKKFATKGILIGTFFTLFASSLALYITLQVTGDYKDNDDLIISAGMAAFYTALIFFIRGASLVGFSMSYYCNSDLTPTLLVASVFSVTNVSCRFATIFAPLAADIVPNPSILVSVMAFFAFVGSFFVKSGTKNLI